MTNLNIRISGVEFVYKTNEHEENSMIFDHVNSDDFIIQLDVDQYVVCHSQNEEPMQFSQKFINLDDAVQEMINIINNRW